jgi:formate hydrogenlyase subunit 3/multisubunit Na+/H+ antiporter MnhD subunit
MNILVNILLILFAGSFLSFTVDSFKRSWTGIVAFVITAFATLYYYMQPDINDFNLNIGGIQLQWGVSPFRMFFIHVILILSVLSLLYSISYMKGKARLGYFYAAFLMTILGMFGVTISKDFISLFIFWEIMTWSSFLLIIYNAYYKIKTEGLKYMIFSAIGAYAMLTAIVFIYHFYGTFDI